ncbi:hypothetical protein TIFTF001_052790 [Ficus carica]|uniref:MATH domain-containing protein n=1 Tax=Ficus carica TaxID=3494 RepID=A0AA88JFK4_FICCA|nr:hypothetical protein TIFTF001_052789 [Ficus carica]GMN72114.1 hypothetical protein TIFTF001_052790 [Ficus carica]
MASPRCPSFSSSSEKPEKSRENSELPSDLLLSEDDFSNEFHNLNYDTGFQTAPSSPPHTSVSADSSLPAKESTTNISSLPLPKLLRQPNIVPSPILLQDATVRRFHCLKTQWGIVKFMDLETFNHPPNGYLVNDTCSFGVEVFIVKTTSKAECLSMLNNPKTYKITWNIPNVSRRKSDEIGCFIAGDYKWRVRFYPNAYQAEQGKINNNVFVALELDSLLPAGNKLFVRYTFRVMDQKKDNHVERSGSNRMSSAFGFRDFMSQAKFKDPENGYLVDDACILEAEFEVLGLVTVE